MWQGVYADLRCQGVWQGLHATRTMTGCVAGCIYTDLVISGDVLGCVGKLGDIRGCGRVYMQT